MRIRRGRAGLAGMMIAATVLLGSWVLVAACGDEQSPRPTAVPSGNPGGGVGGGSQAEADGAVRSQDASTPVAAADSSFVSCSSVTTNFTCTINPSAGTCPVATTPVSVCPAATLLGCCAPNTSSATCYYVGSTDPASSQAGCQAQGTNAVWYTAVPSL